MKVFDLDTVGTNAVVHAIGVLQIEATIYGFDDVLIDANSVAPNARARILAYIQQHYHMKLDLSKTKTIKSDKAKKKNPAKAIAARRAENARKRLLSLEPIERAVLTKVSKMGKLFECDTWAMELQDSLERAKASFTPILIRFKYSKPSIPEIIRKKDNLKIGNDNHYVTVVNIKDEGLFVFDNLTPAGVALTNFVTSLAFKKDGNDVQTKDVIVVAQEAASLRGGMGKSGNYISKIRQSSPKMSFATMLSEFNRYNVK